MPAVRAFIVEDNPLIRENLIGTLREVARVEHVGYAATETEGLAWLRDHEGRWDLAIVDLFLDGGSGLRILAALRDRHQHQKIVVLSNHATHDMRSKCRELGADAVFDKATEVDDLVDFCLRRGELQSAALH